MKTYLIIILSFFSGTLISSIPYSLSLNCNDLPSYHIIHLNKIKVCIEDKIDKLDTRLTNANVLFFEEINRLESKIDNQTGIR